jgi:hypothetical protein
MISYEAAALASRVIGVRIQRGSRGEVMMTNVKHL